MQNIKISSKRKSYLYTILIIFAFTASLYLTRTYSYLLFHSLSEFLSSLVALSVFLFAWNARKITKNSYFLFISTSLLFVGIIDFLHILSYKGMNIFSGFDANLPTQLWIADRYLLAVSFLISPLFINKKINFAYILLIYGSIVTILVLSIFHLQVFPVAYVEGSGLTAFKIISEYIISGIFLAAIIILEKFKDCFDKKVYSLLTSFLFLSIFSELAFTFYVDVYDIFNMTGHILKLMSYYLLYKAIIQIGLTQPYNLLFLEVEKLNKRKDEFIGMASHELKILSPVQKRMLSC